MLKPEYFLNAMNKAFTIKNENIEAILRRLKKLLNKERLEKIGQFLIQQSGTVLQTAYNFDS
jgi:hypothetical protein